MGGGGLISSICEYAKKNRETYEKSNITDCGNGVLFFDYTGFDFARQLSKYIGEHPTKRVITIGLRGEALYGYAIVVVEDR